MAKLPPTHKLLILLSLFLVPAVGAAQRWTPFGPPRWPLSGFVAGTSGRLLVASAANGVFASDDTGRSWFLASSGLGDTRVQGLAALADHRVLFASAAKAFYRSTDNGTSWTVRSPAVPVGPPVPAGDLLAAAAEPHGDPEILLARGKILVRSADGGATWQPALVQPLAFTALLIDQTDPRSVFAGTDYGGGLFHSADGGATWAQVTQVDPLFPPPFDKPFGLGVYGLAAAPTSPTTLFALTNQMLYRSTDGGVSWHPLPPIAAPSVGQVTALAVLPGSPVTLYTVQNLISHDGNGHAGIFASRDLGATWKRVDADGDNAVPFANVLQVNTLSGDLYSLYPYSLGRGAGRGAHWTAVLTVSQGCTGPANLLRWSGDGSRLYADVNGIVSNSRNGGRSWSFAGTPPYCIGDFRVDPGNSATVFAGTTLGVFGTTNGGVSWKRLLAAEQVNAVAIPQSGHILAGACGIWLSGNSGTTWKKTLGCIDHRPDFDYVRNVQRLVVDPSRPDVLYAAETEYGGPDDNHPLIRIDILRSTDGGLTWHPLVTGALSIAVDPHTPQTLYILLLGGGLQRSTDDGRTWQTLGNPGPQQADYDLVIDPLDPQTLYTTRYQGVFRSRDGGQTWHLVGTGLAGHYPDMLFLDKHQRSLFAGTAVEGLWQVRLQ